MLCEEVEPVFEVARLEGAKGFAEVRLEVEHWSQVGILEDLATDLSAVERRQSRKDSVERDIRRRDELCSFISSYPPLLKRKRRLTCPVALLSVSFPTPVNALAARS